MQPEIKEWRYGFSKAVAASVDTTDFDLIKIGSGMSVNQTSGVLNLLSGTTANEETIIRSKLNFNGDLILRFQASLSQRIANNNFFVELVDKVADGVAFTMTNATTLVATFPDGHGLTSENVGQSMYLGNFGALAACIPGRYAIAAVSGNSITFTVVGFPASGSGTMNVFGHNYHHVLYDGTTATNAKYDAQRNGYNSGDTTATVNTTAAPGHVATVVMINATASFLDQLTTSQTASELTQRASRLANVPSDDKKLYLQIRAANGTTNPASTTTFSLNFISISRHDAPSVMLAGLLPFSQNFVLPVSIPGSVTQGTSTPGTAAANLGKAEDAVAASGDTGVATFGVRIPTTPASPTSAAGDYGTFAIDLEGKQVQAPYAGMEQSWQTNPVTLTTTSSTSIKAAAAAGVRNYLTDIDISNTSATATRIDILDNVTIIRSFWVEGGKSINRTFSMPLRGTAATQMNVQSSVAVTDVRVSANGYIGI